MATLSTKYLIVLRGRIASGKTTMANALGSQLGIPVIDKDDIKDIIDSSFADTREAGRLSYEVMWKMAEKQLMNGLSVICDSPLASELGYRKVLELASKYGARLVVISCECPDDGIWEKRMGARASDPSFPSHRAKIVTPRPSIAEYPIENMICVDTSGDVGQNLEKILSHL